MHSANSPFLTISIGWRRVIVLYFLTYEWLFPVIVAIGIDDEQPLLVPRILLRLVHVLLICWPLVFYRREFGFLHPLILPTLFTTLKGLAKFPLALVMPFDFPLFTFDITSLSRAYSISILSTDDLAWMRLWHEGAQTLALSSYYLGYFYLNLFRVPRVQLQQPRHLVLICLTATSLCVLVGVYFIQVNSGGLGDHLIAMRSGRSALFEGLGQFLFVAEFAVLPVLVWFAYSRSPYFDPRWLIALLAAAMIGMLTSGSRSAFVYPLIVLMFLWWQKAGHVLLGPSLVLAVVAIAVVGGFGMIRNDKSISIVDTSIFDPTMIPGIIESVQKEFNKRNSEESSFAAFAGAENTLLMGRTYVASATFFVPRFIWPGKPRSADAYNMWINFAGNDLQSFGTGRIWGIPVGPVEEAYWNFHVPGIILVFLLIGSLHRWLSNWVWRDSQAPAVLLISVWISINFTGTSISLTGTIRDVLLLWVLYFALGIWGRRRRFTGGAVTSSLSPGRARSTGAPLP